MIQKARRSRAEYDRSRLVGLIVGPSSFLRMRSPTMSQGFDPERDGDEHRCCFERPARANLVLVDRSIATW